MPFLKFLELLSKDSEPMKGDAFAVNIFIGKLKLCINFLAAFKSTCKKLNAFS